MKVRYDPVVAEEKIISLREALEDHLNGDAYERGQLESARATADNCASLLALLVDELITRNVLPAHVIEDISYKIKEILP